MSKHAQSYKDNQPKKPATGSGFFGLLVMVALIYMALIALGVADNSFLALLPR
jgi:hypothetical protein